MASFTPGPGPHSDPAATDAGDRPVLDADAGRTPARATVMVVDDEPLMRTVMKRVLLDEGYAVVTAASPKEALALAEHLGRPDLVLTDLCMPGMDGVELAGRLRGLWPGMPIVFMSGGAAPATGGRLAGVERCGHQRDAVLEKPFEIETLVSYVHQALERALAH